VWYLLFQLALELGLLSWVFNNTKEKIQKKKEMEEGYATNKPPMFKGVKYDYWKEKMITHLESIHMRHAGYKI